ncbi:hypothetical protein PMPD1_2226 [Paramixta manurensis]|uniref:SrfA n=1 Tax=Paramixta manurensis TaxID=2740817 RepID=A0A6M8UE34_9GAMM|nr:hypothetical protein PMPD1_2226 [Erwiniaceae bacterium PD-1]
MAKTFLRSGNLDAVLALGENGQPVYASARQLRETLRLKKWLAIADCLAIPYISESGDRLDWYASGTGKVKSWAAANESERQHALTLLESYQQRLNDISQQALNADKPALRRFGALLAKAFHFPDRQYVYLVDNQPVLTFWGFVSLDNKPPANALDFLRESKPVVPEPDKAPPPSQALPDIRQAPAPISVVSEPPSELSPPEREPEQAPIGSSRHGKTVHKSRLWWALIPAAIAAAGAVTFYANHDAPTPPIVTAPRVTTPAGGPLLPAAMIAKTTALPQTLPLTQAAVQPETTPAIQSASEPPTVATPESRAPKDALVMPTDAIKIGSTKFLNGRWRVTLQLKNLPTPPTLHYQFKNGKGTAVVTQGDGNRCQADVAAGLMGSGNLVINSRYTARCRDGSRYKMPQLVCKQAGSAADCTAQYGTDAAFPMTIKRENK